MELSLSAFWALFLSSVNQLGPEASDPRLGPKDSQQFDPAGKDYDFIIVGAGSAGSVLANRLTENPDWEVLLIEAGGDEDEVSTTPYLAMHLRNTEKDWNYTTVKQKRACLCDEGVCNFSRGRVMGGCSSLNNMMYMRGGRADYDNWARLGNVGWSYEDVLPYFVKAENNREPSLVASGIHGTRGPLSVQYSRYRSSLWEDYIQASEQIGFRREDYNGEDQRNVVDHVQLTINGSSRHSTSKAYIDPILGRKNLHILKRSFVKKIILEDKTARGVELIRDGNSYEVLAQKEVILSAGAVNSPKLLMLSGIGPKEHLEQVGIDVIEDLPVGEGLKDHPLVNLFFELDNAITITPEVWSTRESIKEYLEEENGPLSSFPAEAVAFFNPLNATELPTVQVVYLSGLGEMFGAGNKNILWCMVGLLYPSSVGSVKLRSSDHEDPPLIDPNYFQEELDRSILKKGLEKVFEFVKTPAMSKYSPRLYTDAQPLCNSESEVEYIDCVLAEYSESYYHPVGTARMGPDGSSVLGDDLAVKGTENLRVVDSSVMPDIPRASTNAPTIMIAEKAADIIKLHYQSDLSNLSIIYVTASIIITIAYIYQKKHVTSTI